MKTQALSADGDWQMGRGPSYYLTRSRAIAQRVKTRLQSWRGDFFGDPAHGLRWSQVLGYRGAEGLLRSEVSRIVQDTEGVARVERIIIDTTGRNASVTVRYIDTYQAGREVTIQEGA